MTNEKTDPKLKEALIGEMPPWYRTIYKDAKEMLGVDLWDLAREQRDAS